jgi:hypothetical protein
VTLTESLAELATVLNFGYNSVITVESQTLVTAAHQHHSRYGPRTIPARYAVAAAVSFPAANENHAISFVGLVRGLGGTVEELQPAS